MIHRHWRFLAAIAVCAAIAVTANGSPAAATPTDTATVEVSSATQATPREWIASLYMLGATIEGPRVVLEGIKYQPRLTRIFAQDGMHYALFEFNGGKYAISEANGAIWDTHLDPFGPTTGWSFTPLDIALKIARILIELWQDPLLLIAVLLIICLILIFIMILIKYYYRLKLKEITGDRFNQWNTDPFIPLWLHDDTEIPGHPSSFHNDMRFLAGINPPLNNEVSKYPTARYWLDTGKLPVTHIVP